MRVLHLPTSVGGNSWGLAQGEKQLGLDSDVLIEQNNWLNYKCDITLFQSDMSRYMKLIKRLESFFRNRNKYDVFHFNFGSSLFDLRRFGLHLLDLPFYNGKKIMTYNGCDARQKYPTMKRTEFSPCHNDKCYGGMCNSGEMDRIRKKRISIVDKNVDHIFSLNPDLMYFLPNKTTFLPYTVAGWDAIGKFVYILEDKIKIVHAPTNRAAKGSDYILKALDNLKIRFPQIEVVLVENLSYEKALKVYSDAHIVIDQVLAGWYGALGVEVMKMGKPLAVYIREDDLKFIPSEMAADLLESVININPFNIEDVLSGYIENSYKLKAKSNASLEYVFRWHDPKYVAGITKSVYESARL